MISRSNAQSRSDVIRNETGAAQNTHERVGSLLRDLSDSIVFIGDPASPVSVVNDASSARPLSLNDRSKFIRFTGSSPVDVTVPANGSVAFPIGTVIYIRQDAAASVTLVPGGGVTLNAVGSLTSTVPGSTRVLTKVGADEWDVSGDSDAERIPTQMIFTEVFRQAWFDGVTTERMRPPELLWVNDDFSDSSTGRFTLVTEATVGSLSISAGQATLTNTSGTNRMSLVYEGDPIGMPHLFTTTTVTNRTGPNGAYAAILLGIVRDGNNYIVANWNDAGDTFTIQTKIGGVINFDGAFSTASWTFPITLGFSLVGNWVSIFALVSGEWVKVVSKDVTSYVDFKAQDHSLWYAAFGFATPNTVTNTAVFTDFAVSRFGGVGIRDICVVTNEDGSPYYASETVVKALATLAGANGGIPEASMGVFDIDLEKKTFVQTGVIMVERSGRVENDHAGHLIRDASGDQHITVSTWGDVPNPTRIVYEFVPSSTDLFVGSHVLASSVELALTELPASGGQYDPFLIRRAGTWYMAYTATPVGPNLFYPALDSSADLVSWSNVGADAASPQYEGTRILPFAGESYVLTGGPFNMKMYDLAMGYIGIVNCISPGDGGTQPHAMIFPYRALNLLVTFDSTPWPDPGGVAFSWGSIRWLASPRY